MTADQRECREALSLLFPEGAVVELRALGEGGVHSGYFTEMEKLVDQARILDAGVDSGKEGDGFVLTADSSEQDLEALVTHLNDRQQALELKERDIIQREQMVSSLEESVLKQVEKLWKLKTEVSTLLDKMGEDYKTERKAHEEKLKREEALRAKKREEFKKAAEEISEERAQRIVHLTATIKGMRASSGAGMLASMDEGDAVAVLRQLGARQAAGLLGNMPPAKAAMLAGAMLGPKAPSLEALDGPANPEANAQEAVATEKQESEE